MPEKSLNSAKTAFADKDKILAQLNDYVRFVKRSHPEVEKVGFFGSYATDTYCPASDVDLLIILRHSSKRFLDRIPEFMPENLSVGCDIFCYTEDEISRMQSDNNPWLMHILNQIKWL